MKPMSFARTFTSLLLLVTTGCMSTHVDPAANLEIVQAKSARPALAFDFHQTADARLFDSSFDSHWSKELDGEDLAEATAVFREALEGVQAFGAITRAKPGAALHCTFQLRTHSQVALHGIFLGLSLGLIPDCQRSEHELVARVTAPGKETKVYRARTNSSRWLWLPLAPVGIVQWMSARGDLQETMDSIATQMANDGWLGG